MPSAADLLGSLDETFARMRHSLEQVSAEQARVRDKKPAARAPYPGLRPFLAEEARFFRGREAQIREIGDRLARERCISVLGGSGTGKSSIVRAGVIPSLRRKLIPGRGDLWRATTFAPGLAPMDNLVLALERLLKPPEPKAGKSMEALCAERRASILDTLYRADGGLGAFLPKFREALDIEPSVSESTRAQANVLIVIDQFEELFRQENRGNRHQQVAAFIGLVVDQWQHPGQYDGLYLALTMRTDDLHRCAEFLDLPDFINATSYLIRRLRDEELFEAIVAPVRPPLFRAGLLQGEVEPGEPDTRPFDVDVVGELVDAVEEIGHDPDHLPLLQHLLAVVWRCATERWRQEAQQGRFELPPRVKRDDLARAVGFGNWLELDAYRRSREAVVPGWLLRQCLDRVAEALLLGDLFGKPLTERQRRVARSAFCLMGEIDDRGNVKRRWTSRAEIARVAGDAPNADVDAVIRRFSRDHRLIWARESEEVDVCHEALMRNWPRLERWLAQDREAGLAYLQLVRRCKAWCDTKAAASRWVRPWAFWARKKGRLLGTDALERLVPALTEREGKLGRMRPRYNNHWARRYIGAPVVDQSGEDPEIVAEREDRERFTYLRLSKRRAAILAALPLVTATLLVVILAGFVWQQRRDIAYQQRIAATGLWDRLDRSYYTMVGDSYIRGLWAVTSARPAVRRLFVDQLTSGRRTREIETHPEAIARAVGLRWTDGERTAVSDWLIEMLEAPRQAQGLPREAILACASAALGERLSDECRDAAAARAQQAITTGGWDKTTPWYKGRILACQGGKFDQQTQEKVIGAIFATWQQNGPGLTSFDLTSLASAMTSATWRIKASSGELSSDQIALVGELVKRLTDSVMAYPSDRFAIIPARSLVSIIAALPLENQRTALAGILSKSAHLPGASDQWGELLIMLAQAFEDSAEQHRAQNRSDELRPLIREARSMLVGGRPPGGAQGVDVNQVALARLLLPLVEVAGADDKLRLALSRLAARPAANAEGVVDGAQLALWGRHLALSLRAGSLHAQREEMAGELLQRAQAVAERHAKMPALNLASEGLAHAVATMAEQHADPDWGLRAQARKVAQQAIATTGSAEESAAWARAIVALVKPLDPHEQAEILVEVLKYPTAALTARDPNAGKPENATDVLVGAVRDAIDPEVELDQGPGDHLRVLERLQRVPGFEDLDLMRPPEDPRPASGR